MKALAPHEAGGMLLIALIMTSVLSFITYAGYSLISTNARVVQKYDQSRLVSQTSFQIQNNVACRATYAAVCGGTTLAPRFKGTAPSLGPVVFVDPKGLGLPGTQNLSLALRPHCDLKRKSLNYDYLLVHNGKAAMNPVSRQQNSWRPLYKSALCLGR